MREEGKEFENASMLYETISNKDKHHDFDESKYICLCESWEE